MGRRATGFRPLAGHLAIRTNFDYASMLLVVQWLCLLGLLIPAFGKGRVILRILCFGASLALLLLIPAGRGRRHPAAPFAIAAMVILLLSLAHPLINGMLSGVAQVAMYAAVFSPLIWVARMDVDERMLRRA